MDKSMLQAYNEYIDALKQFKISNDISDLKSNHLRKYNAIRTYLDINELVCIGVNQKAFDQKVCYRFWGGILNRAATDAEAIIKDIRTEPGYEHTYDEILDVSSR